MCVRSVLVFRADFTPPRFSQLEHRLSRDASRCIREIDKRPVRELRLFRSKEACAKRKVNTRIQDPLIVVSLFFFSLPFVFFFFTYHSASRRVHIENRLQPPQPTVRLRAVGKARCRVLSVSTNYDNARVSNNVLMDNSVTSATGFHLH